LVSWTERGVRKTKKNLKTTDWGLNRMKGDINGASQVSKLNKSYFIHSGESKKQAAGRLLGPGFSKKSGRS